MIQLMGRGYRGGTATGHQLEGTGSRATGLGSRGYQRFVVGLEPLRVPLLMN